MSVLGHTAEVERYAENADLRVLQKTVIGAFSQACICSRYIALQVYRPGQI
jgi:hypothetical protein